MASSLLNGLLAYYAFETLTLDSSGNGNTLTNTNTVAQGAGKILQGAVYDGAALRFLSRASFSDGTTASSHSFWLKTTTSNGPAWGNLKSPVGPGYLISIAQVGGSTNKIVWDELTSFAEASTPAFNFSSSFANVVIVYDGTQSTNAGKIKMYINSNQQSLVITGTVPSSIVYISPSSLYIGSSGLFGTGNLNGTIDEYGIWNRALTPVEVNALYNNGSGLAYPLTIAATTGLQSNPFGSKILDFNASQTDFVFDMNTAVYGAAVLTPSPIEATATITGNTSDTSNSIQGSIGTN